MKPTPNNTPLWMSKIDLHGQHQLRNWRNGLEPPPSEVRCFVVGYFDLQDLTTLAALGVVLNVSKNENKLHTGSIPYAVIQQVCELPFIEQLEFPKKHYPNS